MFSTEEFVSKCRNALDTDDPAAVVAALMEEVLASPADVSETLNRVDGPMVDFLYRSSELTVANMRTAPGSVSPIHNHRMWAVIGIYGGQEDNHIYRRRGTTGLVERQLKSLRPGDIFVMDPELIHAIENPLRDLNGALHVYGGDLQSQPGRSLWDPQTSEEMPYTFEKVIQFTQQMNAQKAPD